MQVHQKCPLCAEYFMKTDLKPVRFRSFRPPVDPLPEKGHGHGRGNNNKQRRGETCTFTLLLLERGSIRPLPAHKLLRAAAATPTGTGSRPPPVHPLPIEGSEDALYSRLTAATLGGVLDMLAGTALWVAL